MGLSFMLIASLRIYFPYVLAEMGLKKEFRTLQIGQADEGYSRWFFWLNQSQFLNTCSFLLFFFDIITLVLVYLHL